MSRIGHAPKEIALTAGAVGGVLCFLLAIASVSLGLRPLVVQSGSMQPTVKLGALVVARDVPAAQLRTGDVVTVDVGEDRTVTHRIVGITHRKDSATLLLRGDANRVADPQPHTVTHAGRMIVAIPFAGRVAAALAGPFGLIGLGAYVTFLLFVLGNAWRDRPPRAPRGGRRKMRAKAAGRVVRPGNVIALLLGAVLVSAHATPQPAWAAWTDTVAVGTSQLSTYTVPPPTLNCGALGVLSVTFNWTAVSGATNYTLFYNSGANSLTTSSTTATITAVVASATAWVRANRNFGSTTWSSVNSNTRTYTVAVVSLCG
jgi:signal peptidase I